MSRRKIVVSVGALGVAAFLTVSGPAEALGLRAGGRTSPAWSRAWQAVSALWQGALQRVGLGPVTAQGDEGGGIDPYGKN
jgi:hypothetical protein